ncbi:hypothetical protein DKX38_008341 [Salix brachista]|uniref:Mitochondrial Rho GTPase n=1 Tax=Salix brachista TaxID=2182728 RepID=A0A5N5MR11_9ROSI|nr:hypothetical protein DKX38_008341 [Salix brachista]
MPGGDSAAAGGKTGVRIVVVGDRGTGKSSLIAAAATESFSENVSPVLPPTRLPADFFPDRVPITIIDTSANLESRGKLNEELKRADVIVLTYACDFPLTLTRLSSFWLQEFRRLEVKVPVIVVGCKVDLRDDNHPISLEQIMGPIMQQYREIETCIECSAVTLMQVKCFDAPLQPAEIVGVRRVVQEKKKEGVNDLGLTLDGFLFLHSLFIDKGRLETTWAVLRKFGYGIDLKLRDDFLPAPLKHAPDQSIELTIEAVEFVRRVFRLFDTNNRGALRPAELDELFSTAPEKQFVPDSKQYAGLVLFKTGLNSIKQNRTRVFLAPSIKGRDGMENQIVMLVHGIGQGYLMVGGNFAILHKELLADCLFAVGNCKTSNFPWDEAPYKDATERTTQGNLTLKGFLSEWALMTMLDPRGSLANLLYIGYGGNPASALHVTRRRSVDRKKQQTERNVFHCLVFGPKNAGKSTLLNSFIGRPFSESHEPTAGERYAVNVVDQPGGNKKTLILREIPEDGVKKFLSNKESLSSSDVAVFVYDSLNYMTEIGACYLRFTNFLNYWLCSILYKCMCHACEFHVHIPLKCLNGIEFLLEGEEIYSDEYSWKRSNELLEEVSRHGEESGYGVPSLIIAAKDDLDQHPRSVQNSVCQELGIGASIPVSSKLGDMNNVFCRILSAAEHPHLNIPETVAGREHKQFRQLFNHSLLFMSVGAAFAVVGMAALRAYGGRRNSSR